MTAHFGDVLMREREKVLLSWQIKCQEMVMSSSFSTSKVTKDQHFFSLKIHKSYRITKQSQPEVQGGHVTTLAAPQGFHIGVDQLQLSGSRWRDN